MEIRVGVSTYFLFLRRVDSEMVEERDRQVGMRIQRRVRMGKKDELGSPYILSPS